MIYEEVLNHSLFEKEKIIVIERCSDKIYEIIEDIFKKKTLNVKIILNANILEKKSKLRNLFEKSQELIIIPTYKDTSIALVEIAKKFFIIIKLVFHKKQ